MSRASTTVSSKLKPTSKNEQLFSKTVRVFIDLMP